MYTNNYSQLKEILSIDLIKIINFHFNQHFNDLTLFIPFINSYTKIIIALSEKYKEEKDALIKELTNVTYSQVTGKGEGGKWLQEHADMGR